nr:MAG TPA: Glycophorin A [Caudoviricetes sp.]
MSTYKEEKIMIGIIIDIAVIITDIVLIAVLLRRWKK